MSADPEGNWIEFTLPELGEKSFKTPEEFGAWLQDEEEFATQHLNSVSEVQGIGAEPRKNMLERLTNIKADFERAKSKQQSPRNPQA